MDRSVNRKINYMHYVIVAAASVTERSLCLTDEHWPELVPGKFDFEVVQFGTKCG